ncbi:MAG: M48 family metalloprotease [Pseudomonadota bacterium]
MSKLQGWTARCMLVAFAASGMSSAFGEDLAFYSARINSVANDLVANIRPDLDERARRIVDDIEFESPATWETNADARRGFGNRRVVEFNAGFLAVTDWLAMAMIADWAGHAGCLREYSEYLSTLVGHNSKRIFKGRELHVVQDFDTYAAASRGQCEGALQDPVFEERKAELRSQILDSVATTVLLHEIAHHVLEHTSGQGNNFIQRRLREIEADRWAINTGVSADYDLRTSVPLFLFLAATGGGTLEDEIRSSHPSGLHRVRDLLVQTRTLLDRKDPVGAHLMDASIDDLNKSLF